MVSQALGQTVIAGNGLFGSGRGLLFWVGLGDGPADDRREPAAVAQECLVEGRRFCPQAANEPLHGRHIRRQQRKTDGKHRQAKRNWQGQKHSTGKQQKNAEDLVQEWHQAHGSSVSLNGPVREIRPHITHNKPQP